MRLFTSIGPNPRVVVLFAAEKGMTLPTVVRSDEDARECGVAT